MARDLPSYIVRNLVEAALKRNEPKAKKKRDRKSLCAAIPAEEDDVQRETFEDEEVQSLLKLHKRFEDDALRRLRKRTVQNKSSTKPTHKQNGFNGLPKHETVGNEDYFHEISSKLHQMQFLDSPTKFPALANTVNETRRLPWSAGRRPPSLRYAQKGNIAKVFTGATQSIRPQTCPGSWHFTRDDLGRQELISNYQKNWFPPVEKYSQNVQTLQQLLTIVPLTSETFAVYDSMSRFDEADRSSDSMVEHEILNSRNSRSCVVPVGDRRSEDAISVNYEKYANDDVDIDIDMRDVDSEFTESSRALVEYKPIYKKNVHFSEDLCEIHLYSPVQAHKSRRRRRRRAEEDD